MTCKPGAPIGLHPPKRISAAQASHVYHHEAGLDETTGSFGSTVWISGNYSWPNCHWPKCLSFQVPSNCWLLVVSNFQILTVYVDSIPTRSLRYVIHWDLHFIFLSSLCCHDNGTQCDGVETSRVWRESGRTNHFQVLPRFSKSTDAGWLCGSSANGEGVTDELAIRSAVNHLIIQVWASSKVGIAMNSCGLISHFCWWSGAFVSLLYLFIPTWTADTHWIISLSEGLTLTTISIHIWLVV